MCVFKVLNYFKLLYDEFDEKEPMEKNSEIIEKKTMMKKIGSQLIRNPKLNPYKIFKPGFFRVITTPFRVLPDFINIGASKCGTTSLYNYLIQHPNIFPAFTKETHFFDWYNTAYYRSNFPTIIQKFLEKKIYKRPFVTGESTPLYMFYPNIADKIKKMIPKVKLIVLLRNPVDRAYSQYSEHFQLGYHDNLTFEQVIKKELKILSQTKNLDYEFKQKNIFYLNLTRGVYVDQLKCWMEVIPKEKFLIISTEDFLSNIQNTINKVFEFLELPNWKIKILKKHNVGNYNIMNNSTRQYLIDYFKPYNERLYKLLNQKFEWDK